MSTTYVNDVVYTTEIVAITCRECGLVFGLSKEFIAGRRKDHRSFYCPNGHSHYYPQKNTEEQLRRQLEAARSLAQRESNRRQSAEYQARAYKGQVTKVKRRIGKGVCPCCNRSFPQLRDHMAEKHPDYAETEVQA